MTQHDDIAASIREAIKDHPNAEVRINPTLPAVPPHIAGNILELLKRVQVTGMESIAWIEAYNYLQQFVQQAGKSLNEGVPFNGVAKK